MVTGRQVWKTQLEACAWFIPPTKLGENQGNFLLCFKSEIRVEKIDVLLQRDTGNLAGSPLGAASPVSPERNRGVRVVHVVLGGAENYLECSLGSLLFFCPPSFLISPIFNISAAKSLIHSCGERK